MSHSTISTHSTKLCGIRNINAAARINPCRCLHIYSITIMASPCFDLFAAVRAKLIKYSLLRAKVGKT